MMHHESRLQWKEALRHMEAALEALDVVDAPSVVGSHLDFAICRLEKLLGAEDNSRNVQALRRQVEEALLAETIAE
jgi:hypothetical protein